MRVRLSQPCYIGNAYHEAGSVLEVPDEQFTPTVMEQVEADVLPTRMTTPAPKMPTPPLPESGGREIGVETDDLMPQLDPGIDDDKKGGKSSGGGKKKR